MNDAELLRSYRDTGSEAAFRELVDRYIGMVHATALGKVRNPDWADEVYPLYALYPSRHHPPAKVRAFLDFIVTLTGGTPAA